MHPRSMIGWALVLATLAAPAAAQYQWRDENGRMTFSDRAPPVSVREADVLRRPQRAGMPAPAAAVGSAGKPGAARPGGTPAASLDERELAFRNRRAERAQAERQDADARAQAERRAQACDDARSARRSLESGIRVARVAESGEREFLPDEARARRLAALQRDLQEQCGGG